MASFAQRLIELRREMGLTQEEFAKAVGIKRPTIGNWETGFRERPGLKYLERLADYFGVSIDYLMGRSDIRNIESFPADTIIQFSDKRIVRKFNDASDAKKRQIERVVQCVLESDEQTREGDS